MHQVQAHRRKSARHERKTRLHALQKTDDQTTLQTTWHTWRQHGRTVWNITFTGMKWIDVNTKLPNENISVLVIDDENYIWIMQYNSCKGWYCPQEGWSMNVTHWMKLPLPPNVA